MSSANVAVGPVVGWRIRTSDRAYHGTVYGTSENAARAVANRRIEQARGDLLNAPLDVPSEALEAMSRLLLAVLSGVDFNGAVTQQDYARAIARPIVAAELNRLATESFYAYGDEVSVGSAASSVRDALRTRAHRLLTTEVTDD